MVKETIFNVGDLVRYEGRYGKVFIGIVTETIPDPNPLASECYVDGMKQWINNEFLTHIPKGWTVDTSHIGA